MHNRQFFLHNWQQIRLWWCRGAGAARGGTSDRARRSAFTSFRFFPLCRHAMREGATEIARVFACRSGWIPGHGQAAEPAEQVGACRMEYVGVMQCGSCCQRHRDGTVQLDNRGGRDPRQLPVERGDLGPVGRGGGDRPGVASGKRRLPLIGSGPFAGPFQVARCLGDLAALPVGTVLMLKRHGIAVAVDAGTSLATLQEHAREETGHLLLVRHDLHEGAAERDRRCVSRAGGADAAAGGTAVLSDRTRSPLRKGDALGDGTG